MAANTQTTTGGSALKAYAEKVTAQMQEAKARLDQLETKARDKSAQAESAVIKNLKAAKQNIDRRLQDLKTTDESNVSPARADIDADIARLKASIDELAGKLKAQTAKR
jgi:uncharacterized protein YicC (UPF0701 family)